MVVEGGGVAVDCAGWVAGAEKAGLVLTPGSGVVAGLLPPELNPIATAIPTNSTATAVPMTTTAGSRDQGTTGFFFSGCGRAMRSKFSARRSAV